jgi:hypothetical protein
MTFSRTSIFAVTAVVAALFFAMSGSFQAIAQGNGQFDYRVAPGGAASPVAAVEGGTEAPVARVVVSARRMTEGEKLAFDAAQ